VTLALQIMKQGHYRGIYRNDWTLGWTMLFLCFVFCRSHVWFLAQKPVDYSAWSFHGFAQCFKVSK